MEIIILILLAYLLTGLSLTAYDFSAHPLDRKGYVSDKNYTKVALVILAWPFFASIDVYFKVKFHKSGARYFFGVILLAVATFLWTRLFFSLSHFLFDSNVVCYSITVVPMLLASPYLVYFTMPPHRPNPEFKIPW